MATQNNGTQSPNASTNGGPTIRIPLLDVHLTLPGPPKLAYYAGLGAMAAFEFIDWPVALVIAAGHEVATRTRNPEVQQAAEGTESGA